MVKKGDKVHVIPPNKFSGSEGKVTSKRGDNVDVQFDDVEDPQEIPTNQVIPLTED